MDKFQKKYSNKSRQSNQKQLKYKKQIQKLKKQILQINQKYEQRKRFFQDFMQQKQTQNRNLKNENKFLKQLLQKNNIKYEEQKQISLKKQQDDESRQEQQQQFSDRQSFIGQGQQNLTNSEYLRKKKSSEERDTKSDQDFGYDQNGIKIHKKNSNKIKINNFQQQSQNLQRQSSFSQPSTFKDYNTKISLKNRSKKRIFIHSNIKQDIFRSLGRLKWIYKQSDNNQKLKNTQQIISNWCTGFIISNDTVITTANIFIFEGKQINLQNYEIKFYPYLLQNQIQEQNKFIIVKKISIHPKFLKQSNQDIQHRFYDMAIVKLSQNKKIFSQYHLNVKNKNQIKQNQIIAIIGYNNKLEMYDQDQTSYINNNSISKIPNKILKLSVYQTYVKSIQQQKSILYNLAFETQENQKKIKNRLHKHQGLSGSPIIMKIKNQQKDEYHVIGMNKGISGTSNLGILFIEEDIQQILSLNINECDMNKKQFNLHKNQHQ